MTPRARASAAPVLVVLAACGAGEPAPEADSAPDVAAPALAPRGADTRLFAIEGFSGPEAVKYDPVHDVYLVSNFGDADDDQANDGFLSRVSAEDGTIEALRWAVGDDDRPLQEPRGMALAGDTLWVADARGLHAFDRTSGAQLRFVDLTALEPGFLNDVAVAPGGVYVTDTGTSRLIHLTDDGGEVVVEGEALGPPNGVTWDAASGRLILVPWQGGGDSIRAWDPVSRTLSIVGRTPGGRFDGVEVVDGALVVASQADSALHVVRNGAGAPFQRVPGRPADIAVDTRRARIAVPYIALDRVDVFPGPGGF